MLSNVPACFIPYVAISVFREKCCPVRIIILHSSTRHVPRLTDIYETTRNTPASPAKLSTASEKLDSPFLLQPLLMSLRKIQRQFRLCEALMSFLEAGMQCAWKYVKCLNGTAVFFLTQCVKYYINPLWDSSRLNGNTSRLNKTTALGIFYAVFSVKRIIGRQA